VSTRFIRRDLPYVILAVFGILALLSYYIAIPAIETMAGTSRTWVVVVGAFAVLLGAFNVVRTHIVRAYQKKKDYWLSAWLLFIYFSMIVVGLSAGTGSGQYKWMYGAMYTPLAQGVVGTLGLFLVSAAYRAFKIRTIESLVFFLGFFLIAVRQASIGPLLWPGFETIGNWVTLWPSTGTMRAVTIGLAIGTVALALRTLARYERIGLEEGAMVGGG